jgi:hypothetical protein
VLSWAVIVGALYVLYSIAVDALDWIGRAELIESRWPRLWSAMHSRPMRLLSTVIVIGLLIANLKEIPEPPSVAFPSPDPGAERAEIAQLRSKVEYLEAIPSRGLNTQPALRS